MLACALDTALNLLAHNHWGTGKADLAAALQILIANEFYNLVDVNGGVGAGGAVGPVATESMSKPRDYARVTLAGFCILAIASLLTIIFEAVTDPNKSREEHHAGRHGGRGDVVEKRTGETRV